MRRFVVLALLVASPLLVVMAGDEATDSKAAAKAAPAFTLKDTLGKTHSLDQYKDKIVVLEWTEPGCPYIVRHSKAGTMKKIAADYKDKNVVFLGICTSSMTESKDMEAFRKEHSFNYPVLMDETGAVGHSYESTNTPHMFILQNGKIVYEGAIDDDQRGRKGAEAKNFVRAALDELIAGQAVTTAKTKPYG